MAELTNALKAPFPWFGGKSRVADLVWAAIGDVDNYVEAFAGSLAVLLGRPGWTGDERWTETVNDKDAYLSNFWRALAADPDAVAEWCDWPVNETDLTARHLWLVNAGRERIARMQADAEFYDAKVAGWWVWGLNSWIGSGWCSGKGPWIVGEDGTLTDRRKLPHLGSPGQGVNRKLPHLGNPGQGVNRKLPHLGNPGRGVNRKLPHLGNREPGPELSQVWTGNVPLRDYFAALAARLRRVRVCCGDWQRVVTDGAMAYGDTVGVFLDPPYDEAVRNDTLYNTDGAAPQLSHAVRQWAIEHGDDPRLRIVLCGYNDEHAAEMPGSWRVLAYSANAAYQNSKGGGKNAANRHEERLWFSPNCIDPEAELAQHRLPFAPESPAYPRDDVDDGELPDEPLRGERGLFMENHDTLEEARGNV